MDLTIFRSVQFRFFCQNRAGTRYRQGFVDAQIFRGLEFPASQGRKRPVFFDPSIGVNQTFSPIVHQVVKVRPTWQGITRVRCTHQSKGPTDPGQHLHSQCPNCRMVAGGQRMQSIRQIKIFRTNIPAHLIITPYQSRPGVLLPDPGQNCRQSEVESKTICFQ